MFEFVLNGTKCYLTTRWCSLCPLQNLCCGELCPIITVHMVHTTFSDLLDILFDTERKQWKQQDALKGIHVLLCVFYLHTCFQRKLSMPFNIQDTATWMAERIIPVMTAARILTGSRV